MRILCVLGRHAYGDPSRGESYEYANFLPALRALCHEVEHFDCLDRSAYRDFAELNRKLLERVAELKPDLIFCVLMQYEIWVETLDLIRAHTPAEVLNWGTDDSWKFNEFSRFIASHVDLHVTTDHRAAVTAQKLGLGNVVRSQWATSSARLAEPLPAAECKYDVSFVGAAYGDRLGWIERLRAAGVDIACFGHGWKSGPVATDDVYRIYRQSRICLNFADSGLRISGARLQRSRQIKARTFEVPGAGGLLLTQGANMLHEYFDIGREIVVFETPEELSSLVRRYLADSAKRDAIARAGYERVRAMHTYEARFPPLLAAASATAGQRRQVGTWSLAPDMIGPSERRHRAKGPSRFLGTALAATGTAIFGRERGLRASRRLLFEASWRLTGVRTYSAAGLPGRLFYREK